MDFLSYNLATLNINNISNQTKVDAFKAFVRLNEIDIIFIQEVENDRLEIPGFELFFNINERRRGVAIGLKNFIEYRTVERSLDARLLLIKLKNGVTLCNIYAPTGSQSRVEREDFFNLTCAHYLRNCAGPIIFGGDFNSIVNDRDATGGTPRSEMTSRLTAALDLIDVWRVFNRNVTDYTFLRAGSGSRIDRVLVTKSMRDNLRTIRHSATCFSDHKAVIVRLILPRLGPAQGNGLWRLNVHVLDDEETMEEFQNKWRYLVRQKQHYSSWLQWWVNFVKPKLASFFRWHTSQQLRNHRDSLELLHGELTRAYGLYLNDSSQLCRINRIKALMLKQQRDFSSNARQLNETYLQGEPTSLFHVSEKCSKRAKTVIRELEDQGEMIEGDRIEQHVVSYFEQLFAAENTRAGPNNFLPQKTLSANDIRNEDLMNPADEEEIWQSIKSSAPRKSPGEDGLPREFYAKTWNIIRREFTYVVNDIMRNPEANPKLMNGIIVLVKKKDAGNTIKSYRPITLLNVDYKIVSRILKQRMSPLLEKVLSSHQKCSNGKQNIFQATSKILDKISAAKHNRESKLLVSFDLDHAFDRVDRRFLFEVMERMNFNRRLIDFLRKTMGNSSSRILLNGKLSQSFQIGKSVRQGDPLSMLLFVIFIQPLIDKIEALGHGGDSLNIYADDISLFVPNTQAATAVVEIIEAFQDFSGARLNRQKTVALEVGRVRNPEVLPWLNVSESVKVLGITFANSVKQTMELTWVNILRNLKWRLWNCKSRGLNLLQKITHINTFVLSKLWYVASTLPLPKKFEREILKELRHFLWIRCRQPIKLETLFLPKVRGGQNLHSPGFKSIALLTNRILDNIDELHFLRGMLDTPVLQIPAAYPQVKAAALEIATLSARTLEHHASSTIYQELIADEPDPDLLSASRQWRRIFENVNDRRLPSDHRATWYRIIHGKVQHKELLYRQHRCISAECDECPGEIESIEHKFFACSTSRPVWLFLKQQLSIVNPILLQKPNNFFLFPELYGLDQNDSLRIKILVGKYFHFIIKTPKEEVTVENLNCEL